MSFPTEAPVIIVGGGPVGMGLAIELAQHGVATIVVERHESLQPIPKGQNLTQRTMEHMWCWGVETNIRAARTIPPEYGIGGLTAYGTLLGQYRYDWLQRELVRPFYFTDNERLPQYATERVLRERAAELPRITALYGWQAETVRQAGDDVFVTIAERDGGGREEIHGRYVVGCDGSRSLVRDAAGISQGLEDADRLMVLLVFRSTELHKLLARFPGKSFYKVLHPDFGGYWQFFGRVDLGETWFFHAPVPAGTTRENFDFAACLHRAVGAGFAVDIDYIGFWDLRFAVADAYRSRSMFIAGDAAHSHPPYGGYGVNSGLEDARNLGWKLAARLQGWGSEALLDSYDLERRPVFASTARDFIARSIAADRDFLRAFNPDIDRAAFEKAWSQRAEGAAAEVNSFEPHYEGSPAVFGPANGSCSAVGKHSFAARAGHHLAPHKLPDGRDVFEELGRGFSLIVCGPGIDVAKIRTAAAARGVPLTIVDAGGSASEVYKADLVLVRPDHFVAWAGTASRAEEDLFGRVIG